MATSSSEISASSSRTEGAELNDFQRKCFGALEQTICDLGASFATKSIESSVFDQGPENYVHGRIAEVGLEFWIYEDAAMFSRGSRKRHFEPPDFKSSDLLMAEFIRQVAAEVDPPPAT